MEPKRSVLESSDKEVNAKKSTAIAEGGEIGGLLDRLFKKSLC